MRHIHKMITIGIAGPSCSGKSSIARRLEKVLESDVLSLDQFAINGAERVYIGFTGEKIRSFEQPQLYDGARTAFVIKQIIDKGLCTFESMKIPEYTLENKTLYKKKYLVAEGFLLFTYQDILPLIDYKFYIDLGEEEAIKRRKLRGNLPKSDENFMKIGMKEYEIYGLPQKKIPGIIILDGMKGLDELAAEIIIKINKKNR
jgi:uridine kinase